MSKKKSKKSYLKLLQRLKLFFHLCLGLSFFIIVLSQYGLYQKHEMLTISTLVGASKDISKFKFTICPHQTQRIINDSIRTLGPGFDQNLESLYFDKNSTFGDMMKFYKPPEHFIRSVSFGFTSQM